MKNTINLILLAVSLLIGSLSLYKHYVAARVAYVDTGRLLDEYQGMIDARTDYRKKANAWQANIDTLAAEVQNAIKDYERESPKMTAREKALSQELIGTKQQQLADYQRAIQDKAGQEDAQMTRQVLDQVNAYLKKYGQARCYKIILATTGAGNIAYADESMNLTDEVLEGLNQQYLGN